jgi:hypothetical protein
MVKATLPRLSSSVRFSFCAFFLADDAGFPSRRDYACNVPETPELLTALNLPSIKEEVRSRSLPGLPDLLARASPSMALNAFHESLEIRSASADWFVV